MDLIRPLWGVLDLTVARLSMVVDTMVVDTVDPLDAGTDKALGLLECHATLSDGRIVLFGFYQHAARQVVTADMWIPWAPSERIQDVCGGSTVRRRQEWSYGPRADAQALARTIVAEVTTWLLEVRPASGPDPEAPCADA